MDAVLERALAQAEAAATDLQLRSAWACETDDSIALLSGVQALINQLTGLQAAHVQELTGRGWPAKQGVTSMTVWLRDALRISVYAAKRLTTLGALVDDRPAVSRAVMSGAVNAEQALVIADAIVDLPDDTPPEVVDACEARLIEDASVLEPRALRILGERILAHVAPDLADAALKTKLDRDEERARIARAFTLTSIGRGQVRLSGCLDVESAAVIRAAIDPWCRPVSGPDGDRDPRVPAQRRADALVEVCRLALATDRLPDHGGMRPQLHITVGLDALTGALGVGTLDTGESLSTEAVRRLACDAGIIPAVLGSTGEILDLGRQRRLYSGAARRALALRDEGCAFPHCDRPPQWCDGHHVVAWLDGGETNVDNGVLLCGFHHRTIHHGGWEVRIADDKMPEFIPPTYVDPLQRPQRNRYHRRR